MIFSHNAQITPNSFAVVACLALSVWLGESLGRDLSTVGNCSRMVSDFNDGDLLTREERIRRMDRAFEESLTKFEECQAKKTSVPSASSAPGASGAVESVESQMQEQGESAAVKSSEFSGDEPQQMQGQGKSTAAVESHELSGNELEEKAGTNAAPEPAGNIPADDNVVDRRGATLSNGKLPDDIPTAANDDALANQLRQAAQSEQDPQKQARLWNEYRKYKGLEEKPLPE